MSKKNSFVKIKLFSYLKYYSTTYGLDVVPFSPDPVKENCVSAFKLITGLIAQELELDAPVQNCPVEAKIHILLEPL